MSEKLNQEFCAKVMPRNLSHLQVNDKKALTANQSKAINIFKKSRGRGKKLGRRPATPKAEIIRLRKHRIHNNFKMS